MSWFSVIALIISRLIKRGDPENIAGMEVHFLCLLRLWQLAKSRVKVQKKGVIWCFFDLIIYLCDMLLHKSLEKRIINL